MNDLILACELACAFRGKWNLTVLKDLVQTFEQADSQNNIAWDFNSGEDVCGFLSNGILVAYVHVKFPIGFATKEFKPYKKQYNENLFIVTVNNFDKAEWRVDLERMGQIAPEISWSACVEAVNPSAFSIDDFRYATH